MLHAERLAVAALDDTSKAAMYAVLARHFQATSREQFERDLAPKQWVLLLRDNAGTVQGFSTLQYYAVEHQAVTCRILYSGDTVIDRQVWGEQELAFHWLRFAGQLQAAQPEQPLYWFLISKGPRTFRYLPAFARSFYPHWQQPTPAFEAGLLDHLAQRQFGADYDATRGVVHFAESHGHLRPDLADISARELRLPAVRFFLQRNPGYRYGDELCCLCRLAADNLKPLAQRLFLKDAQPETST